MSSKKYIAGSIQIVDGTQGAGKVLMSDSNGLATWSNISATGPTGPTGSSGASSYRVLTGLITQTGTSAPTIKILENTLGVTPVWSYQSTGNYKFTSNGLFTLDKTIVFSSDGSGNVGTSLNFTCTLNYIHLYSSLNLSFADSLFSDSAFEVRIYN